MRGRLSKERLTLKNGKAIAAKWREMAESTLGIFVLRDSLFSQQDNAYQHEPFALMLPPNWVTAALLERPLRPVRAPDVMDDRAWTTIPSPSAMFGSFPPSITLYKIATRSYPRSNASDRERILNVRTALRSLAKDADGLIKASENGLTAIAREGAKRIAESDRRYFGEALRRQHVIPIFVENPTSKEIREGKGMGLRNRNDIPSEIVGLARDTIYTRRLKDGDIAIERYDLSQKKECERALAVLEKLIPRGGEPGGKVWLWVTGRLDSTGKLSGEDASEYIQEFKEEVANANIDPLRLEFVNKPDVRLPKRQDRRDAFQKAVDRFNKLQVYFAVNLTTVALRPLVSSNW
jgi:hypothetical protein